jgi:hypothetical protein
MQPNIKPLVTLVVCFFFNGLLISYGQSFDEGQKKLAEAKNLEHSLYPSFTEELFNQTIKAYHQAGETFFSLNNSIESDKKVYASYYTLVAWGNEGEMEEALNRYRPVCDIFVNTFDQLIPAEKVSQFKQNPAFTVSQNDYDSVWNKTLWMLYFNTIQAHKDIFVIKYGSLLKTRLKADDKALSEVLLNILQSNLNLNQATEAYILCEEWFAKNKISKPKNEELQAQLSQCLNVLINNYASSLSAEQIKNLERWSK